MTRVARQPRSALAVAVVGAPLTALPRRLPGIGRIAQLTLAQFVQAVLLPARQLKIAGTLGRVDVDRIGRFRVVGSPDPERAPPKSRFRKPIAADCATTHPRRRKPTDRLPRVMNDREAAWHASSRAPWASSAGRHHRPDRGSVTEPEHSVILSA